MNYDEIYSHIWLISQVMIATDRSHQIRIIMEVHRFICRPSFHRKTSQNSFITTVRKEAGHLFLLGWERVGVSDEQ